MNTLIVIGIILVLCWGAIYTVSYGIWTLKENKLGGIAILLLAAISVALPLYILWIRL